MYEVLLTMHQQYLASQVLPRYLQGIHGAGYQTYQA
jgi:hypothetical protein